jgi:uncharacterized protein (DUF2336 family)
MLVQKSRSLAGLQEPLAARPDLPPQLAARMCEWVSEALKAYIKAHYAMTAEAVDTAMDQARQSVRGEAAPPFDAGNSARKLVEKLAAGGQLKAGFLMRVLTQGQLELFDLAFARLLGLELGTFRHIFYDSGARAVALACRAAGIDRAVFSTVFGLSRQLHGMDAGLDSDETNAVDQVFFAVSRPAALDQLRGKAAA